MAILRDQLFPTVTNQIVAQPKQRNSMLQPAFGSDPNKIQATSPVDPSQQQDPNQDPNQQQYLDQPITGDYIMAGLQKLANRPAPPALDPGSRVKIADTSLTTPDNFQSFYDMLGSINARGQSQLAAAQSIAQAKALAAAQNIAGQIGGSGTTGGGGTGTPYSGPVGKGVQQWAGVTQQAMKMLGIPDSYLNAILRRMNQESGGNPNAINNWDSNAKAGHPSQGLMQTIPGTFNAYAGSLKGNGIYDPLANIYAGLNYAGTRYGPSHGGFLGGVIYAMNKSGGY